jgi:hypothetical protein
MRMELGIETISIRDFLSQCVHLLYNDSVGAHYEWSDINPKCEQIHLIYAGVSFADHQSPIV